MACSWIRTRRGAAAWWVLLSVGCGGSVEEADLLGAGGGAPEGTGSSSGDNRADGGTGGVTSGTGGDDQLLSTGGALNTGGSSSTGGSGNAGNIDSTGGSSASSTYTPLLSLELGDPNLDFADVPLMSGVGSCAPPCSLELVANGDENYPADEAFLYVDFDAPSVTLSNEDVANANDYVMRFTYEDNHYGHGTWASGLWWTWTEGEMFDSPDDYSEAVDRLFTAQFSSGRTGEILLVAFSHGATQARIHWARIPACTSGPGVCENTTDCAAVNSGDVAALSQACGDCYEALTACSATNCENECPGQGGNVCMSCEVDAGCHTEFMACTGLDFMPMNSLTFPN